MIGRGQTSRAAEGSTLERQTHELAELREIVLRQSKQIERLLQQQQDRQEPPATHLPPPPSPSLMLVVLNTNLLRKYTGHSSNIVTICQRAILRGLY